MLVLTTHIEIGSLAFSHATEIVCSSSWRDLGDKCTVTFPRNVRIKGAKITEVIKVGDNAIVKVGYGNNLFDLIVGSVVKISPEMPISISIEDEFYKLRRQTVSGAFDGVTLRQLLEQIVPGTSIDCPDMNLSKLRFSEMSVARVLLEIQKIFGIYSYFRNGKLVSGFAYGRGANRVHDFDFQQNVISSNLTYVSEDERKIKVKAVSFQEDGSTIEYETGDAEGDQRTLHYYHLNGKELKAIASAEISRLKVSGYEGEIVVLGLPKIQHGDGVMLIDNYNIDRQGQYFVDHVLTSWGEGGFRQTVKLGKQA